MLIVAMHFFPGRATAAKEHPRGSAQHRPAGQMAAGTIPKSPPEHGKLSVSRAEASLACSSGRRRLDHQPAAQDLRGRRTTLMLISNARGPPPLVGRETCSAGRDRRSIHRPHARDQRRQRHRLSSGQEQAATRPLRRGAHRPVWRMLPCSRCSRRSACRGSLPAMSTSSPAGLGPLPCRTGARNRFQLLRNHFLGRGRRSPQPPGLHFNPSNDAWFAHQGPPQHLAQAPSRGKHSSDPLNSGGSARSSMRTVKS